ncbi:MAG: hypothetical protein ACYCW6_14375 [Candidatus Xenobia bacterium]
MTRRRFLVLALAGLSACALASDTPEAAEQAFFKAVREQRYREAYGFLAESVQHDVPYREFVAGADRIKAFRVVKQEVSDREANLVKFNIRASVRLLYRGRVYDATYAGKADVYRESGRWRVLSVDLKAVNQKDLGPDTDMRYGR